MIEKCFNVIRICIANKVFMPDFSATFEGCLEPVYATMEDPSKITYEDDVITIIKNFITINKQVSENQWKVF